jgi:hypothetical protein
VGFFLRGLKVLYNFSISEVLSISLPVSFFSSYSPQSYSVKRTNHHATPHLPSSQSHHHCRHYLKKLFTHTLGTVDIL